MTTLPSFANKCYVMNILVNGFVQMIALCGEEMSLILKLIQVPPQSCLKRCLLLTLSFKFSNMYSFSFHCINCKHSSIALLTSTNDTPNPHRRISLAKPSNPNINVRSLSNTRYPSPKANYQG